MNILKNKLKNIPHLPLNITYDVNRLLQEFKDLPYPLMDYIPFKQSWYKNNQVNWKSLSLSSIGGKILSNPEEPFNGYFEETLKDYCPYTYEVIESVGGGRLLARYEEIVNSAGWHSHQMQAKQPDNIAILQIPLLMPEDSKFSVVSYMDYRGSDFRKPFKVYEQRYEPGQMYILNSYHYHNAFNYSSDPMITIRVYIDLNDQNTKDMVEKAVNSYTGEVVESYENYMERMELGFLDN